MTNPDKCRAVGCRNAIDVYAPDGKGYCDKHNGERLDEMERVIIEKIRIAGNIKIKKWRF